MVMIDVRLKGHLIQVKIISSGKIFNFESSESATGFIKKIIVAQHTKKVDTIRQNSIYYREVLLKRDEATNE